MELEGFDSDYINSFIKNNKLLKKTINKDLIYLYNDSLNKTRKQIILNSKYQKINYMLSEEVYYNFDGMSFLMENFINLQDKIIISEYYEGKKFFVFFNKKWNIIYKNGIISENDKLYKIFFNLIGNSINNMKTNFCYHFLLIDNNSSIVNYTDLYGDNFEKLV